MNALDWKPSIGLGGLRLQAGEGDRALRMSRNETIAFLRYTFDIGYRCVDTADAYGPEVNEDVIGEAFAHPRYSGLAIASKGGFARDGVNDWVPNGRPEYLKAACKSSLARLRRPELDLYQLHCVDPLVPLEESVGALNDLRFAGLIRAVGLCNVSADEFERARRIAPIDTVQNYFNALTPAPPDLLHTTLETDTKLVSWFPLEAGALARMAGPLGRIGRSAGLEPAQLALMLVLSMGPNVCAIPGTTSREHARDNLAAAQLEVGDFSEAIDAGRRAMQRLSTLRGRFSG